MPARPFVMPSPHLLCRQRTSVRAFSSSSPGGGNDDDTQTAIERIVDELETLLDEQRKAKIALDIPSVESESVGRLSVLRGRLEELMTAADAALETALGTEEQHEPGHHEVFAMTVSQLKEALKKRGLAATGLKAELRARLLAAVKEKAARRKEEAVGSTRAGGAEKEGGAGAASTLTAYVTEAAPAPVAGTRGAGTGAGPMTYVTNCSDEAHGDARLADALREVLTARLRGPMDGIFTDGSCEPNPGPGGWGVVCVRGGRPVWSARGCNDAPNDDEGGGGDGWSKRNTQSTNNRMEMTAIIRALRRVRRDVIQEVTIYSDSNLCVQTLNEWAAGWAANGWVKKSDMKPPKNLDLVKEAYALKLSRPFVRLQWIKAHDGSTWNEYADRLASSANKAGMTSLWEGGQ